MNSSKTRLWIFIDWYLPAYKAGGPIQSISNLVSRLKDEFDISVITSNLDLGEPLDMEPKDLNSWVQKDGYQVIYLDSDHQNKKFYQTLFREHKFDVVYFNSLFSLKFTLLPLWILRNSPIRRVLATRGMLGKGALAIKPIKKTVFLKWFRFVNLHKKVVWHATADSEVKEIKQHFGAQMNIVLAPNLSAIITDGFVEKEKQIGILHVFFLSRIAIKKNLMGALKMLSEVNDNHRIRFRIIGPIDDAPYWEECQKKILSLPEHVQVEYLGAIPNQELSGHLKDEHILLLPTHGENFGHVIMESWQNACPVIISDQTPWLGLEVNRLGYDLSLQQEDTFVEAIEHFSAMTKEEYNVWSESSLAFAKRFVENPEVLQQNRSLFFTFEN